MQSRNQRFVRNLLRWGLFVLVILLVGCSPEPTAVAPTALPTATLPPPEVHTTQVPEIGGVAGEFLESWQRGDYAAMYQLLTSASQAAISEEQFTQRYQDVVNEAAMVELRYEILSSEYGMQVGQVAYQSTIQSAIVGDILRDQVMNLELEAGDWRVRWDETMILPELAGGNYLRMDPEIPVRSTIYDRVGSPLAAQTQAVAIGLYPGYVDLEDSGGLLSLLSTLIGYPSHYFITRILDSDPNAYLPIGEVQVDKDPRRLDILASYGAVVTAEYTSRYYPDAGIGPHIVGYVSAIQEDETAEYRQLGYGGNERVGREGIELWGEDILSGQRGGTLYVFDPEGKPVGQLGAAISQPGEDIYTTLNRDLQKGSQLAMGSFSGAVVVLERDTGRILSMVSSPGFNPNAYEFENANWSAWLNEIVNNPDSPHFNRATQGLYPLGSVFKIITLAAAMESGLYTSDLEYDCGYVFEELPGFPRYDWTYDHFQEDGVTRPSGVLTLMETLIRSCNPFYWHIGLDLYNRGLTTAISDMARGFGLGSLTGIDVVEEKPGNVPDPESQVDAINLAIGQGDFQVTPIQVANFAAALGNGGTLYRPQAIEQIVSLSSGVTTTLFAPDVIGTLPVSPENLEFIQESMKGVVRNRNPVGTAYYAFAGLDIPVAGKTGTATAGQGEEPHAWFAGYTFAEREDQPDIAIAVIVENGGEGSEYAAPIFRRIVEYYFYGAPRKLYWWEANFDVTRSPTPIVTDTPTPGPEVNP